MPNPNVVFGGQNIILPGAYSAVKTSELVPSSFGLANRIAIIGECTGGQPNTPLYFRSGDAAKAILRSGDLLDAIRMAYDPSGVADQGGADLIVAIRVNPATQSTLPLAGASGTLLTLTSRDFGAWTTGIQVKVEAGTSSGRKITIQYVDSELGTITEVYDNLANATAAAAAINSGIANGQPASQFVTAVVGGGTESLALIAFTNLAGGTEGTTTSTQWTAALAKLELEDVDIVVPLSVDPTITAMVKTHVDTMSNMENRKERIAIIGGAAASGFGTTDLYVADLVSKAATLASSRVMLVAPGIKRPNNAGVTTLYGSQFLAAMVAGITAALEIGHSPTHKFVKVVSIDTQFTTGQLKTLLLGGVSPVEFKRDTGFRVVQALTTYQIDANPANRQVSVRRVIDFLMTNIRTRLETEFVGVRADQGTVQSMLNSTVSVLEQAKRDRFITAYRNVTIKIETTGIARVNFEFSPSEAIDYILITAFAKPGSLAATFSGQPNFSNSPIS